MIPLPELDSNLIMWINLIAVIITLLLLIRAYSKEDVLERRYKILSQNYDTYLAEKILEDMEKEDPEKTEKVRAQLREKLKMPEGKPRILINPDSQRPEEVSLEALLLLDRLDSTRETGGNSK